MNTPIKDPDHEEISYVVDGRTGEAFSPAEYAQRSADQAETKLSRRFIMGPIPPVSYTHLTLPTSDLV